MTFAHRFCALLAAASLMGCGSSSDMKDKLGLSHRAPDEYRVVPRPPLSVPPEFNLVPPGNASPYLSGMPSQERARSQVLGTDAVSGIVPVGTPSTNPFVASSGPAASGIPRSGPDAQFLSNLGVSKADPQVRQKLLDEASGGAISHDPRYLFGGKTQSDSTVDASKEADRIKQDKAQNKPVTAGETPVVQPEDKGLLGGWFR